MFLTVLFRCDFKDNNLCGMKHGTNNSLCNKHSSKRLHCENGTFNWLLNNGSTPSSVSGTGIDGGYLESVYYIYMEASFVDPGLFTRFGYCIICK